MPASFSLCPSSSGGCCARAGSRAGGRAGGRARGCARGCADLEANQSLLYKD